MAVTYAEHFFGGALTVALFAFMMSRVDRRIGATHYTLLAAVEVWGKQPAAMVSGAITDATSYPFIFALAFVLLTGAGLLLQSFTTLMRWDPGFDRSNILTVWALAPSGKYENGLQIAALQQRAVEELQSIPSVRSVGNASAGPMFGGMDSGEMLIAGRPTPPAGEQPIIRWFDVGPAYFRTLGTPIVRGLTLQVE